jgi:hypothetical protein
MEKKIERRLRCFNCGRWNVWDKPLHPDCLCGDAQYTSKALSNQPIEEKWKIDFRKEFPSFLTDNHNGKIVPIYNGWWVFVQGYKRRNLPQDIEDFIENLLEQERTKLVKQIDSFPLSDSMFFDENNWEAGYKALEEFKLSIINK